MKAGDSVYSKVYPRAKRLKRVVSKGLIVLGRFSYNVKSPVLLYHSIDNTGSVISLSPREFKFQMRFLKGHGYHTISLDDYVDCLNRQLEPPEKIFVITFDDGFKNNYTEALPVLRGCGFTCTIFVATDFVGKRCPWERDSSIVGLPMLSWTEIREMRDLGIDFGSHGCSHAHLIQLSKKEISRELLLSKSIMDAEVDKPIRFFLPSIRRCK